MGDATYSLANAPLNAAQAPLAIAKKIHCVRVLHCRVDVVESVGKPRIVSPFSFESLSTCCFEVGFRRCRAIVGSFEACRLRVARRV